MDIFGKPSSVTGKQKSPFQNELAAKMKDRKSRGLAADLTETEEEDDDDALASDDDLLAAYTMKTSNPERSPSQSPWRAEADKKVQPPKPQLRTSLKDPKQKQKIPINKPKNELDRLLADDEDEVDSNMIQTQKKPWQPPQFKNFSEKSSREPSMPEERQTRQSPLLRKPQQQSPIREDDEGSDEELTGAYTRQLEQRGSPFGRQTPTDRLGSLTPTNRKSPLEEKGKGGRMTPKGEDMFGSGKPQKSNTNMDDIFGKRKSPTDQDLFGRKNSRDSLAGSGKKLSEFNGRKTPQEDITGRKTPQTDITGRKTPQADITGRKTPQADITGRKTPQADITGRKTPQADITGRKTPKQELLSRESPHGFSRQMSGGREGSTKQSTMDDIFGARKRAESPLFQSKQLGRSAESPVERDERPNRFGQGQAKPQPTLRKGSYMSSLLADSDEEQEQKLGPAPSTRTSYLNNLLGDEKSERQLGAPNTRSPYLDNLLDDNKEDGRSSRPRQRAVRPMDTEMGEERDSSIGRDVDKDPIMIETMKKQREEKRQIQKGKAKTKGEQANFDIEEVADAQNSLTMTYIKSETTNTSNQKNALTKPKSRKATGNAVSSPSSSEMSFESAADIRNYIYKEWSEKKRETTKMNMKEKKRQEKEEELKKEKEKVDKKLENEATFRTWKEQKDARLKEQIRDKKRKEEKEKERILKEQEKKKDATKIFQKWKESKDEQIVENRQKQHKSRSSTLSEKQEVQARKQKDAEGAFDGWKKRKERQIRQSKKQEKEIAREESTQKMSETRRREIGAEQLYEKWLQRKEEQNKREKMMAQRRRNSDYSPRPAWSPANKTIPCGR